MGQPFLHSKREVLVNKVSLLLMDNGIDTMLETVDVRWAKTVDVRWAA